MKVFAISDIHIDQQENWEWIQALPSFADDILLLAGDITHEFDQLIECMKLLVTKFQKVFFVIGNHDLWLQNQAFSDPLEKFNELMSKVHDAGVSTSVLSISDVAIVPLFSWYDFTFGYPSEDLLESWGDFQYLLLKDKVADSIQLSEYFHGLNQDRLNIKAKQIISFSHFLPRLDLMPPEVPLNRRFIYPVLGSYELGKQLKKLRPSIHIYGHSHRNRDIVLGKTRYVNCALGYTTESDICKRELKCIAEF